MMQDHGTLYGKLSNSNLPPPAPPLNKQEGEQLSTCLSYLHTCISLSSQF